MRFDVKRSLMLPFALHPIVNCFEDDVEWDIKHSNHIYNISTICDFKAVRINQAHRRYVCSHKLQFLKVQSVSIEREDYVALIFFHHFDLWRLTKQLNYFAWIDVENYVTLAWGLYLLEKRAVVGTLLQLPTMLLSRQTREKRNQLSCRKQTRDENIIYSSTE